MKIRLGVVGPHDSIELVKGIVKDFHEIDIFEFPYKKIEEVREIIPINRDQVDQWFFSGRGPYYLATSEGLIREEECSFAPLNSNSVYRTLLEAQLQEQKIFKSISIDIIKDSEAELKKNLTGMNIYTFTYTGLYPYQEMIDFHSRLFEEGKSEVAVTCVKTVHDALQERGIPSFRVRPDAVAIRLIIQFLKQRGVSQWYRRAQVAMIGVEIDQVHLDEAFSYKTKFRELEVEKRLLEFAELVNGSFSGIGNGRYFIYTTRGEMELQLERNSLLTMIEGLKLQSQFAFHTGVGYGITSLEAEQNARLATRYARLRKDDCMVIIDETKKIVEFAGSQPAVSYDHRISGQQWEEKLAHINVSPATVSRIRSLAMHYRKYEVTSKELALWMNSTERNARRILAELEKINWVRVAGEEQPAQRGRPRKVFHLSFIED